MQHGSVVFDLAAESGGNCELTKPGEALEDCGVTIFGYTNIPSTVPYHASYMYAKNIVAFLQNLIKDGTVNIDLEDQIIKDTLLTHHGEVVNLRVQELLGIPSHTATSDERSHS